nr:unnamed protein product [Callosobruchus chinensis]
MWNVFKLLIINALSRFSIVWIGICYYATCRLSEAGATAAKLPPHVLSSRSSSLTISLT